MPMAEVFHRIMLRQLSGTARLLSKGHVKAQAMLATAYNLGKGVEQDTTEAIKWYRKAAEQGDPYAQAMLKTLGE